MPAPRRHVGDPPEQGGGPGGSWTRPGQEQFPGPHRRRIPARIPHISCKLVQ